MSVSAPTRPASGRLASRVGGAAACTVDLVLLIAVNGRPGWQVVPFLTPAFADVLPWVNACLVVGAVGGVLVALTGSSAVKAAGDAASALVGAVSVVRIWQVFPFDLPDGWQVVFRLVLAVGLLGCIVGFLVASTTLFRRFETTLTHQEGRDV